MSCISLEVGCCFIRLQGVITLMLEVLADKQGYV